MNKALKAHSKIKHIGLVDADLLCIGTRHPNLALLKIAGYLRDNGYERKTAGTENENEYTGLLEEGASGYPGTRQGFYELL